MKVTSLRWFSFVALAAVLALAFLGLPLEAAKPTTVPAASVSGAQVKKINLNTADLNELQEIRGIGPKMAERIISYRDENKRFQSPEELINVRGIGPAKYERLKEQITV